MSVTTRERQLAEFMARENARVEVTGVNAAKKVGTQIRQRVVRAVRNGRDPLGFADDVVDVLVPMLTSAMVVSHLTGVRRSRLLVPVDIRASSDPYVKALRFLKQKLLLDPAASLALEKRYESRAITFATTYGAKVSNKLQSTLLDLQSRGAHVKEGVSAMRDAFDSLGMTSTSDHLLETLFRTSTQMAYSAGKVAALNDPDVRDIHWGYKYVTVGDARVRFRHVPLEGVTLPKSDPFWQTSMPPNGWNCRCQAIPLFNERKVQPPPGKATVEGVEVQPGPDRGFAFNPGRIFPNGAPAPKLQGVDRCLQLACTPKKVKTGPKSHAYVHPSPLKKATGKQVASPTLKPIKSLTTKKIVAPGELKAFKLDKVEAKLKTTQKALVKFGEDKVKVQGQIAKWNERLKTTKAELQASKLRARIKNGTQKLKDLDKKIERAQKDLNSLASSIEAKTGKKVKPSVKGMAIESKGINVKSLQKAQDAVQEAVDDLVMEKKDLNTLLKGGQNATVAQMKAKKKAVAKKVKAVDKAEIKVDKKKLEVASITYNPYMDEIWKESLGKKQKKLAKLVKKNAPKDQIKEVEGEIKGLEKLISSQGPAPKVESPAVKAKKGDDIRVRTAAKHKLTRDEFKSIDNYTSITYSTVIKYQRTGKGNAFAKKQVEDLVAATKKLPKFKGTVYRGIAVNKKTAQSIVKQKSVELKSFASTSKDLKVAKVFASARKSNDGTSSFVEFHMRVKTGADIELLSSIRNEREVLLSKGTKFKVVDVEQIVDKADGRTGYIMHVEES